MTSDTPADGATPAAAARARLRRPRRPRAQPAAAARLGAAARLLAALILAGGVYTAFAPGPAGAEDDPAALAGRRSEGKALFDDQLHHLPRPQRPGRRRTAGPSLIGVGSAAVEFQVGTGRMPMARQEAQAEREDAAVFTDDAGPPARRSTSRNSAAARSCPPGDDLARRRRRRRRAASCSGSTAPPATRFGGGGGALSSGKYAPDAARRDRPADLRGDADRPAEHAGLRRQPAHARRRSATSSPTSRTLQADQDPGGCRPRPATARSPRVWRSSWSAWWPWSSRRLWIAGKS